ncbi:hypothetical protein [Metallosphaera javensis (ex Hofmann et al. 2022)]|uniref:hypothetical protein n=1 Tax=Metallosphaera javensis (ex Hofmann et al. 2022) TaxID=99938 RepID=UPI001EDF359B|nr:hypothetical protein [Metallosphaera javensis (ex Hofmann et al. 2022)]
MNNEKGKVAEETEGALRWRRDYLNALGCARGKCTKRSVAQSKGSWQGSAL